MCQQGCQFPVIMGNPCMHNPPPCFRHHQHDTQKNCSAYSNMTINSGNVINRNNSSKETSNISLSKNGTSLSNPSNNGSLGNRFFQVRTPFNSNAIGQNPMTTSFVSANPRVNAGDLVSIASSN